MSKLHKKPSALLERLGEHLALRNMPNFFSILWVIFSLLDPDSGSGYGSTDLIVSGSNPDPYPDPIRIRIRIRNTACILTKGTGALTTYGTTYPSLSLTYRTVHSKVSRIQIFLKCTWIFFRSISQS